ncbi:hypothetical protein AFLA_011345 [Aspergillus flavus NRRL3357]|nr:hypothetical protein AFLA_011345 [Aspergillus flavus NRRL3357]
MFGNGIHIDCIRVKIYKAKNASRLMTRYGFSHLLLPYMVDIYDLFSSTSEKYTSKGTAARAGVVVSRLAQNASITILHVVLGVATCDKREKGYYPSPF